MDDRSEEIESFSLDDELPSKDTERRSEDKKGGFALKNEEFLSPEREDVRNGKIKGKHLTVKVREGKIIYFLMKFHIFILL